MTKINGQIHYLSTLSRFSNSNCIDLLSDNQNTKWTLFQVISSSQQEFNPCLPCNDIAVYSNNHSKSWEHIK